MSATASSYLETLDLVVSTLSPVHIGCGQHIEPGEYLIDDNADILYELGSMGLCHALTPLQRQELLKLLEQPGEELLLSLQRFFQRHQDNLKPSATRAIPISPELSGFYQSRLGQVQQRHANGRGTRGNKLEIERTASNRLVHQPYLPGSSLKGAIRTALLNALNGGKSATESRHNSQGVNMRAGHALEEQLLGNKRVDDDPLKALKVADAMWQSDKPATDILFAVNRKRQRSSKPSQAEDRGLYTLLECVGPARSQAFHTQLALHRYWQIDSPQQKTRFPSALQSLDTIIAACNAFYRPQLEAELTLLEQLRLAEHYPFAPDHSWLSTVRKLLSGSLGQKLDSGQAFLLRIGKHGGAESNTLEGQRHIKIMRGGRGKDRYQDTPTTLWLAGQHRLERNALLPFGWVVVEVLADTPCETMKQALNALNARRYQGQRDVNSQLETLQAQQAEELEAARQKAQAAEAEAAHRAEHERQRAQMSPVGRAIDSLNTDFEEAKRFDNREPAGALRQALNAAIELTVQQGTGTERQELKALAKDLFTFWQVDVKKNKKAKELLKRLHD